MLEFVLNCTYWTVCVSERNKTLQQVENNRLCGDDIGLRHTFWLVISFLELHAPPPPC